MITWWRRSFYMPSPTDKAGHTKAFIYPVMDHWGGGGSQRAPEQGKFEPPTCRFTVEHANHHDHDDHPK